jgi:CHRD domain-containing protein
MNRITMVAVTMLATAGSGLAFNGDGARQFRESLNGLKEAAAVVSTTGTGTFKAEINLEETEIAYELTFENLEGDVRQAHIHIGLPQNAGGIVLWLCDSDLNPSPIAATPACNSDDPANLRAGKVSGTLTEADVQNAAANGIAGPTATTPGEFAEVIALIRAGKTYANLHTAKFPPGEIRSQIEHDHGQ